MKQLVVVGGGFAGAGCAQKLACGGKTHVTLAGQHIYRQFQLVFYQLATPELAPSMVEFSLRKIFHKWLSIDPSSCAQ